jgi:F-type H+-transporting ATPase subunit a
MHITPDEIVFWQHGFLKLNATIVTTWGLMLAMTVLAWLVTRQVTPTVKISRWQNLLEIIVSGIREQLAEIGLRRPERYIGFIGTLFLFIAFANLCSILPGYDPPTGSFSTTAALALCVFVAVPFFGIAEAGFGAYLKTYLEPTPLMLPFNILGELTRTLALAVRLFGNMMSGTLLIAIMLSVAPLFFPIFMTALGLLTGLVQAYIFSVLAAVFIAAATRVREQSTTNPTAGDSHG